MAKTSQEIEKEFIESLNYTTGKSLIDWMLTIKNAEIPNRNDIIKWLKENHNFGHMNASLLVGLYLNNGKPVYASGSDLLDNQFAKYEEMRPLYNQLLENILDYDKTVQFVVKKTYVSVTKKREFAAINIRNGELRLGLDLGDMPYDDVVTKSKLTGPMPRISHMLTIKSDFDFNLKLLKLLEVADKRVNL